MSVAEPYWKLDAALVLIRKLQPLSMDAGYYLALAGGVLNKGESKNDLDIVAVPCTSKSRKEDVLNVLGSHMLTAATSAKKQSVEVYHFLYDGLWVDVNVVDSFG